MGTSQEKSRFLTKIMLLVLLLMCASLFAKLVFVPDIQYDNLYSFDSNLNGELSADIYDDGIVDFHDFAVLAADWENTQVLTGLLYYDYEENGLRVVTEVEPEGDNTLRVFIYTVYNETGETICQADFYGDRWVGGSGQNQNWAVSISDGGKHLKFYNNTLVSDSNEQFYTVSSETKTLGITTAEFPTIEENTFYADIIVPMTIIPADITEDGTVDPNDLAEIATQWLMEEY
ncbi:MAG: hypothetical protein JW804_05965 [Sedimentisphaerales bacterium]|nr:hypothetical protein [Sedimentisphaerales bacterium]